MKRHVRRRLSRSCAVVRPCLSDGSCDSSKACGTRRGGPGGGGGWEDGLGGGGAALGGGGRDDLGGGGCDRGGGGRDGGFGRDGGGPLGGGGGCDMTEVYANEGCVCVCVRVADARINEAPRRLVLVVVSVGWVRVPKLSSVMCAFCLLKTSFLLLYVRTYDHVCTLNSKCRVRRVGCASKKS